MPGIIAEQILKGARKVAAHARGEHVPNMVEYKVFVPKMMDVKTIRKKIGMTQKIFSDVFGFDINSVASWESGRRNPDKSARILLKMIQKNPTMVLKMAGEKGGA